MEDPKELLAIVVAKDPPERENPRDIPPWDRLAYPLKHEALMRLLEMQAGHFSEKRLKPSGGGTGLDSIAVWVKEIGQDIVRVIATASWEPTRTDVAGIKYYELEMLEFDNDGRLVTRAAYNKK